MKFLADSAVFTPPADLITGSRATAWRGSDLSIEFALATAGKILLASDIGTVTVEIKHAGAVPSDSPLWQDTLSAADCVAGFTADAWQTGLSPLLRVSIPYQDCALVPGSYLVIIRHDSPASVPQTHLLAPLVIRENHSESSSVSAPPSPAIEYWNKTEADLRFAPISLVTAVTGLDMDLDVLTGVVNSHTTTLTSHTSTLSSHTTTLASHGTDIGTLQSGKRNKATRYAISQTPSGTQTLTTTAAVLPDLTATLAAGKRYRIRIVIRCGATATTRGIWLSLKSSGSLAYLDGWWNYPSLASYSVLATASEVQPSSSPATSFIVIGEFEISTTTSSTLTIEARQGTSGSGTVTTTILHTTSRMEIEEL